jgi:hypothetical protein
MAVKHPQPDPDSVIAASLMGTARRSTSGKPLDVDAALAGLREIAGGRSDLLAEQAELLLLGARAATIAENWPAVVVQVALLVAAGADIDRLPRQCWGAWSERREAARPAGVSAIITHHATWLAGVMNDRTPVILPPDRIDAWLNPEQTNKDEAQRLITGIEYKPLQVRAVSTAVNKTGRGASKRTRTYRAPHRPRRPTPPADPGLTIPIPLAASGAMTRRSLADRGGLPIGGGMRMAAAKRSARPGRHCEDRATARSSLHQRDFRH